MNADVIEAFVQSLTVSQKDQLWEIIQHWNEPALFDTPELSEELEHPTVLVFLESALDSE